MKRKPVRVGLMGQSILGLFVNTTVIKTKLYICHKETSYIKWQRVVNGRTGLFACLKRVLLRINFKNVPEIVIFLFIFHLLF